MALLSVSHLSRSFGSLLAVNDVGFSLDEGVMLGIIGPNGAGKSTLFNLLTGMLPVSAGAIVFDGADITAAPSAARAAMGIARTFQIPQPFATLSVYENLLVAARHAGRMSHAQARDHCAAVLGRLGLRALADTPAGGLRLLDRKRLELARALAASPRLLLLDEIAGGLTDSECAELLAIIRALRAGSVTIIWVEHVVHALLSAIDRLIVMDAGRIIADGPPHDTFQRRDVREIYMGLDA
ncbi:MAG TPA: ABC transporter ATP-binding protein [Thermopetrobacter sp.]|nr:ABC transporter ATP-binding protein [Thermopetrobacter sp.]